MRKETLVIMLSIVTLLMLGALMVYVVGALDPSLENIIYRHLCFLAVGLAALVVMMNLDYHYLSDKRVYRSIVLVSIILLLLVLIPGIGAKVGEARRWIQISFIRFQPSEFARFALILLLAIKLTQTHEKITRFVPGFLVPGVITLFFAGLVFLQNDVGIPFIMGATAFAMMWVAGTPRWAACILGCLVGTALVAAVFLTDFRIERVLALLDPFGMREGAGWQLIQSLSAFSQGGLFGPGVGAGEQKLGYLPAAHTDFIYAVIGEELGLIGSLSTFLLFAAIFFCMLRISLNARDLLGALLGIGIGISICVQALFIMAVTLGLAPTKGVPLPFVSYGGTAMVVMLAMAGILVNIGSQAVVVPRKAALPKAARRVARASATAAPGRPAAAAPARSSPASGV